MRRKIMKKLKEAERGKDSLMGSGDEVIYNISLFLMRKDELGN